MLIDLHAHSSGISHCCRIPINEVIRTAKSHHIDGIVLTNHYQKAYIINGDDVSFAKKFLDEYRYAQTCAKELGFRIFFGIEVTMEKHSGAHLLIYGVDESFVEKYPTMYDDTQESLYHSVKEHGGILVQAHPYRQNINKMLDPQFLDGVELSCHPLYDGTHIDELTSFAKQHDLFLTCGGDYHADTHRPHCGVYIPGEIENSKQLADYLAASTEIKLCVQEVGEMNWQDVTYCKR